MTPTINFSPIAPLSPSTWKVLSGKQQWDCVVALRGPDVAQSATLKWLTTSIIRHKLSDVMRVGGLINPDLRMIILPDGGRFYPAYKGRVPIYLRSDLNHFFQHVREAACILGIPYITLPGAVYARCLEAPFLNTLVVELAKEVGIEEKTELIRHQDWIKANYGAF